MKNIIIRILSIIIFVGGSGMNLTTVIDAPLRVRNFIVSIFVLVFWAGYIVLCKTDRKMMYSAAIFWSVIFIVTIFGIFSAIGNLSLGIINILIIICLSPFYGIRYIIIDPILNLSTLAIISVIFGCISISTIQRKKLA
jgi:hypothetical protein